MYEIHSGGATGTDSVFDLYAPKTATVFHHSFDGHKIANGSRGKRVVHTAEELAKYFCKYEQTAKLLGRFASNNSYVRNLCTRNWFQVSNAKVVVAVVNKISNYEQCICDGGTGYAISYAHTTGKNILVFSQQDNTWYASSKGSGLRPSKHLNPTWAMLNYCDIAGVGTREINAHGILAITSFLGI